jgi:hypothetical protein
MTTEEVQEGPDAPVTLDATATETEKATPSVNENNDEPKKETHDERQTRLKAEARAFALSGGSCLRGPATYNQQQNINKKQKRKAPVKRRAKKRMQIINGASKMKTNLTKTKAKTEAKTKIKRDGGKEKVSTSAPTNNNAVDMRRIASASNQVVHCGADTETEIIGKNKKSTTVYEASKQVLHCGADVETEIIGTNKKWTKYYDNAIVHSKKYTFRDKLYDLMMDATSSNTDIVSWSSDGKLFVVHDHARFASELLPTYFGHKQMRSLDRQLHLWSFKSVHSTKITNKSFGGKSWKHPFFQKGRRDLLMHIERKNRGNSNKKDINKNEKMKKDRIARNPRGEIVSETSSPFAIAASSFSFKQAAAAAAAASNTVGG